MKRMLPGRSALSAESTAATPSCTVVWMSWPQAWATPTSWPRKVSFLVDLNGKSVSSITGSASMSARTAISGPGLPPLRRATTPVLATPVRTSRPRLRSCSATSAAVWRLPVARAPGSGGCGGAARSSAAPPARPRGRSGRRDRAGRTGRREGRGRQGERDGGQAGRSPARGHVVLQTKKTDRSPAVAGARRA